MAWMVVDKDGTEHLTVLKPYRWSGYWMRNAASRMVRIPTGSIKQLTGKVLTWYDDPVEL